MAGVDVGGITVCVMILGFAAVPGSARGGIPMVVIGACLAALANAGWMLPHLPFLDGLDPERLQVLRHPNAVLVANGVALLLIIAGLVRLVVRPDADLRMAGKLKRRGDKLGAAELYRKGGGRRQALALFRQVRAWTKAAEVALELGDAHDAASLLRRAGGRHLTEASRLFRREGDTEAALRCEHDLAEWLMGDGRFDEAIEAWVRASQPLRAARAASIALNEGRLQPSHPAFHSARRAAQDARDHQLLARIHEAEDAWLDAARAWRAAGQHRRAAQNFMRASHLDEAAREEAAAGRPKESARLRIRYLDRLQERLAITNAQGAAGASEAQRLQQRIGQVTESLVRELSRLGMETELIDVLGSSGRIDEAVAMLVELGREAAAAELAHEAQRWDLAAPLLERVGRWGEASDVFELDGDFDHAARCAEKAGEDERALQLFRKLGRAHETAQCLARLGFLQDALIELHRSGLMAEASRLLRSFPGPVPDIPDVMLDLAQWIRSDGSLNEAISCLQRAVLGVALKAGRLDPAVALARLLHDAGDDEAAQEQLERVLDFDYAHQPAQELRHEISAARHMHDYASTRPVGDEGAKPQLGASVEQRYEIQTELGRGGMGVVFQARDTRLDRDVAIKVLRTTSPEEAARLEREAKAAATLNHPGIVTIYDFEAGFGGYFIVMEFVPGVPLDELMRSDPGRVRRHMLRLLIRLADAVAYAHDHRVIHRDLKPGNILLTEGQDVKILDFGIAARLDSDSHKESGVCGTPFYMAPEQIRGETPTPATDVYAFGATAFHLATGRPPFNKGDVIGAHLNTTAPDPLELAPDLGPGLGALILRCLEKGPEDRFSSAAELRDAVRELEALEGLSGSVPAT